MAGRSSGDRSNRRRTSEGRTTGASAKRSTPKRSPAKRPSPKRSPAKRVSGRPIANDRFRELAPIVAVVSLVIVVLAGLAVLPARTWLTQRQNLRDAAAELEQVEAEVAVLEAELELLQTDAEIERQARANFDLVYPGEESYRIVPPGAD